VTTSWESLDCTRAEKSAEIVKDLEELAVLSTRLNWNKKILAQAKEHVR
jgi:hypothetical protein